MNALVERPVESSAQSAPSHEQRLKGRVVLACSGIGHVNRGYEASVSELFAAIASRGDVQLYQGKGSFPGKRSVTTIGRRAALYRAWPFSRTSEYARYRNENLSFAVHFASSLFRRPADIVFTPDHCLAGYLQKMRAWLPRKPTVVFSNGAPFENQFCERFEAVHQKSYEHYAASEGTPLQQRSWLIANGFSAQRLSQPVGFSRSEVLNRYNVDPRSKVVLSLSAHNKSHKRVDWLLREFATLDQAKFTLIVAGQPTGDSEELQQLSADLRCNVRFLTVPQELVPELIWASDLMTLCSLSEGFPRSIAEAMGGERHVFVHPHQNAKWILGDNEYCFVDMEEKSALANALRDACNNPEKVAMSARSIHQRFLDNFTWERVSDVYVAMFAEIMDLRRASEHGGSGG
ncbi:glycosyltransferase family 4 protein [Allorhodopirellula solitaria]|uniref:glycosyltransferase family 4 protein n=1 Tax=Allorhodopirellula solitaria TaxID=2527987 RepID=UPI0016496F8C|nr:glycosyltransferase family 4 protein [Allorhodopirellula solitaria]